MIIVVFFILRINIHSTGKKPFGHTYKIELNSQINVQQEEAKK